ncbi:MAG: UDP-N-acetylglucosamine 2-epimerase (non-hydrolyzing) [Lachnospiraceae bacterium]|nr:UDP-N-acetylglucosamine 2-epimerase (non-hydrolyzing) [Lachnospiraceae bacterium]
MKKILIVFGTRPEAIKMCPLVNALKAKSGFHITVCVTGQHRSMLDQVLKTFQVIPDYDLSIMREGQTLFDITTAVLKKMKPVLEKERPDIVCVHGDTTTSFAAALASFYLGIPIGHVEAGLRTYNIRSPYPEEFNRQTVGNICDIHFAPTERSRDNLLREGKKESTVFVTGNTVIDALRTTICSDYSHPVLSWASGSRLILITAHRRENIGEPMSRMFRAIKKVMDEHKDVKAVYPVHPNPAVRKMAEEVFGASSSEKNSRIHMIEPLDVVDFHNFMNASYLIMTDSGGVQEEAPFLGKPVLVMRDTTERLEGAEAGTLKLVGTDEKKIYESFTELLDNQSEYDSMAYALNPYGDGHASEKISDILEMWFLHKSQEEK